MIEKIKRYMRYRRVLARLYDNGHDHMSPPAFEQAIRQARKTAGYPA
ncbi:MAG TPA: hypothetical protein VFQ44_01870 [Streptosporangiaceae bacterium]|nr:hypothetical protein [Streptosporangiaceae bacterium]